MLSHEAWCVVHDGALLLFLLTMMSLVMLTSEFCDDGKLRFYWTSECSVDLSPLSNQSLCLPHQQANQRNLSHLHHSTSYRNKQ
mmetsp:Transcript_14198/g.39328  ORF Transcript_14198/g.39328 Transcript_14198/m.39328 type:complete len:84 (+) Transcript_14198:591-842(+)